VASEECDALPGSSYSKHHASCTGLVIVSRRCQSSDDACGTLSERAGFSERHLARVFTREIGTTPARYVAQARLEAARAILETSDAPLGTIALQSGLQSAETLRRAFIREVGITPDAYRQRFRTTGVADSPP
jgi:transcriptional regulator GlxA family with amidase domain